MLNDELLERYSRQILLPEIDLAAGKHSASLSASRWLWRFRINGNAVPCGCRRR